MKKYVGKNLFSHWFMFLLFELVENFQTYSWAAEVQYLREKNFVFVYLFFEFIAEYSQFWLRIKCRRTRTASSSRDWLLEAATASWTMEVVATARAVVCRAANEWLCFTVRSRLHQSVSNCLKQSVYDRP